jgi:hypothetical protein
LLFTERHCCSNLERHARAGGHPVSPGRSCVGYWIVRKRGRGRRAK